MNEAEARPDDTGEAHTDRTREPDGGPELLPKNAGSQPLSVGMLKARNDERGSNVSDDQPPASLRLGTRHVDPWPWFRDDATAYAVRDFLARLASGHYDRRTYALRAIQDEAQALLKRILKDDATRAPSGDSARQEAP